MKKQGITDLGGTWQAEGTTDNQALRQEYAWQQQRIIVRRPPETNTGL